MSCLKIRIFYCLIFTTVLARGQGQAELLPLDHNFKNNIGHSLYFNRIPKTTHTSIAPFLISDASDSLNRDSLIIRISNMGRDWQKKNWLYRKVFKEHLVEVSDSAYSFYLDFLTDFLIGKEGPRTTWLNTRGVELGGRIGNKFAFTSYLYENQGVFAPYLTAYANLNRVIPGQGYARPYGKNGFDFGYSGGTISYTPTKYLNVQLGYDKNFIGDGYRSLLLSDNSSNYPFLKLTATLGRVRYMAMWAQFIDFYDTLPDYNTPYPKKYGVFHYLNWNVTDRLSVGLYENIMWKPRGLDLSYVNPILLLRPVEFANGSPDKALIGLNGSYKIADHYVAYGQLMINEFTFKEVFAGNGYWGNKHGGQLGIKAFDLFNIDRLYAQLEMNRVRPYAYSAIDHYKNYGHYGQSLAHPYGANFEEYTGIINYTYKRVTARLQLTSSTYGLDVDGLNYGKDIYQSYMTRANEYGAYIGQGLTTNLLFVDAKLSYLLNPKNNLRLEVGATMRNETNDQMRDKQRFFSLGLRSSFRNLYQDF